MARVLFPNDVEIVEPDCIGIFNEHRLEDSSSVLRAQLANSGYVFLKGLLPRDAVVAARAEILRMYAVIGEIEDRSRSAQDGYSTGRSFASEVNLRAFAEALRTGAAYRGVCEHPQIFAATTLLLGKRSKAFDFKWPRVMRPGEATGIHCDAPYMNRGSGNVLTAWIPLGDVSVMQGGLSILEGSNNVTSLQHYRAADVDLTPFGWFDTNAKTVCQRIGGRWLYGDFTAGDVLFFPLGTMHCSLVNQSDCVRVSSDTRYQIEGDPEDERWFGQQPSAHGDDRAFFPGLGNWNNVALLDEWKPVREDGRIALGNNEG